MNIGDIPAEVGRGAVDLAEVQKQRELEKAQREQQEYVAAVGRARSWDRNMRRAFKGIHTPASRRRFLTQALVREEQSDAAS